MTRMRMGLGGVLAVAIGAVMAQAQQAPPDPNDPRIGLKAGIHDAEVAARHMELVSNLPKPPGFFDPEFPAGVPAPPEPVEGAPAPPPRDPNAPPPPGSGFTNSDLAFKGVHAVVGNYHGFNTYDIENARRPKLVASIVCPGGQGDVSIWGNLLFMSVEQTRGRLDCGVEGVTAPVSAERFRGIRIFDISNLKNPKQVAAIQTCRGSHTHTLVPVKSDPNTLYVYGSGTGNVRSGEELAGCSGLDAKEDPNTSLFSIDVIKVPLEESREGGHREPAAAVRRSRRPAPSRACGRAATTARARRARA